MSHMFSLKCHKQPSNSAILRGLCPFIPTIFQIFFVFPSVISPVSFPSFLCLFHLSFSHLFLLPIPSVSAYAHLQPAGAVRANTDQPFGPIPNPPACADRPSTNLLLISWRDEVIALTLCVLCVMNDALSPHAQFQRCSDLICVFGQTPTVNWECLIKKSEKLMGKKISCQIVLHYKIKPPWLLSLLLQTLRPVWDLSLCQHFRQISWRS